MWCSRGAAGKVQSFGSPHASAASVFVPIAARATSVPASYTVANPTVLDRRSAYWAHKYVFNVAKLKYDHAMRDITAVQARLEQEGAALVGALDAKGSYEAEVLNEAYRKHAERVLEAFWSLPDKIIEKYADGYLEDGVALGYPDWWLEAVGYKDGPPPVSRKFWPNTVAKPVPDVRPQTAEPGKCTDVEVETCLAACPRIGLAACAQGCMRFCQESTFAI